MVNYKTPGFYNNVHLHICSIFLRLVVSLITEIHYLQIEPGGKGTHVNESMMLKMFYLYEFVRWAKCIWWTIVNNYFLVYKLFELAVEWIPLIRIKKKLFLAHKIIYITAVADKKMISVFSVSEVLYSQPQSTIQIK